MESVAENVSLTQKLHADLLRAQLKNILSLQYMENNLPENAKNGNENSSKHFYNEKSKTESENHSSTVDGNDIYSIRSSSVV